MGNCLPEGGMTVDGKRIEKIDGQRTSGIEWGNAGENGKNYHVLPVGISTIQRRTIS